jgi:hypothetical protein
MSWIKASGNRGDWTKAKEGENYHGYSNKENEKPLETLSVRLKSGHRKRGMPE